MEKKYYLEEIEDYAEEGNQTERHLEEEDNDRPGSDHREEEGNTDNYIPKEEYSSDNESHVMGEPRVLKEPEAEDPGVPEEDHTDQRDFKEDFQAMQESA